VYASDVSDVGEPLNGSATRAIGSTTMHCDALRSCWRRKTSCFDGVVTYRDGAGLDVVNVDDALISILARAAKILDRSEIRLLGRTSHPARRHAGHGIPVSLGTVLVVLVQNHRCSRLTR
jgi:hypothetical protein